MKIAKKKILRDFITGNGLKSTRQRELILDVFIAAARPMTVDELHLVLRAAHPKMGRATVCRTLKLFTAAGIACEVQLGDGLSRYGYVTDEEHYDHLVCTRCGVVAKFRDTAIEHLHDAITAHYGFVTVSHKVELYGLCVQCRDN